MDAFLVNQLRLMAQAGKSDLGLNRDLILSWDPCFWELLLTQPSPAGGLVHTANFLLLLMRQDMGTSHFCSHRGD